MCSCDHLSGVVCAMHRQQAQFAEELSRTSELTARAERAEAAVQRVRELATGWASDPGFGEIFFNDAAEAILAALDSTDPVEDARPVIGYKIGDKLYAPEDVWIVRRSDAGLPVDGDERK